MQILKASQADKEKISKLHIASIKKLCKNHYSPAQLQSWTSLLVPSVYDQALEEKLFLVTVDAQQHLVGMAILDINNAILSAMYIHPDHVGKGIGSTLLRELEMSALKENIISLSLQSTLNAKDFYRTHGYIEQGNAVHKLPNDVRLECVSMSKTLQKHNHSATVI